MNRNLFPYTNETNRIPRRSLLNTTSTAVVIELMNIAYNWLQIINFHHIVTPSVLITDYTIEDTETVFAYVADPANYILVGDWLQLFPRN